MFMLKGSILNWVHLLILCFCVCARCSFFFSLPSTSKLLWLSLSLKSCDLILCSGNPISVQRWVSMLSSNAIPQNHWQHAGPEKYFQKQRKTKELGSHWHIVRAELGKEHLEPLKDPLNPAEKYFEQNDVSATSQSKLKHSVCSILQVKKNYQGLFCLPYPTVHNSNNILFQYFPINFLQSS